LERLDGSPVGVRARRLSGFLHVSVSGVPARTDRRWNEGYTGALRLFSV